MFSRFLSIFIMTVALTCLVGALGLAAQAASPPKGELPPVRGFAVPQLGHEEALELRTRQRSEAQVRDIGVPTGVIPLTGPDGIPAPQGHRFGDDVLIDTAQPMDHMMQQCVADDGTIYAVFRSVEFTDLQVQRSTDGGRTWSWYGQWHVLEGCGPPDIAVARGVSDRLIVVAAYGVLGPDTGLIALSINLDDSSYWSTAFLVEPTDIEIIDPRICVDSPEFSIWYPYVIYHQSDASGNRLMFTRSTDFGVNWQAPMVIAEDAWRYQAASLDFGGSVLTVAFTADSVQDVYVTQSGDFGTVFSPPVAIAATGLTENHPVVAAADDGSMIVVAFTRLYSASMTDIDCVWNSGGAIWNQAYLPFTENNDYQSDLSYSPDSSLLHATFRNDSGVVYTQAVTPETASWSELEIVSDTEPHLALEAGSKIVALTVPCVCDPDLNCDGIIDEWDRLALVMAIEDPFGYQNMFPYCDIAAGDLDCNGVLDAADLACFDGGLSCCPGGDYQNANVLWPGVGDPVPFLADQVRSYFPGPLVPASMPVAGLRLAPARPNPFNARTSIAFHLSVAGKATLEIYSPDGKRVATLASGHHGAGDHVLEWDGRDANGRNCSSGIYLVRLETAQGTLGQRLVLVK